MYGTTEILHTASKHTTRPPRGPPKSPKYIPLDRPEPPAFRRNLQKTYHSTDPNRPAVRRNLKKADHWTDPNRPVCRNCPQKSIRPPFAVVGCCSLLVGSLSTDCAEAPCGVNFLRCQTFISNFSNISAQVTILNFCSKNFCWFNSAFSLPKSALRFRVRRCMFINATCILNNFSFSCRFPRAHRPQQKADVLVLLKSLYCS